VRIALVAGPWIPVPPPAYGGTEAVVDRLARGFAAARHEVLLFTTADSTCPVRRAWVRDRATPEQIGQSFVELHHLLHVYDQVRDFDVVLDHTVIGPIYAQGRTRGPIVTTNHGPFGGEMNDICRRMARHAAVVAISHDQASRSSVPISVIHHGLDPERFRVGAGEGECVLFLGRFSPDKGVKEEVLQALDEIDRAACRMAVETHFSMQRMVRDHLDLYERLLAG
jgi:glycosyltransferase involved in cell wall biosynthesis